MDYQEGQFYQQIALVSGGSSGLGWSITKSLLQEGARVIILDIHQNRSLDTANPTMLEYLMVDVTQEDQVSAAIDSLILKHGHIDILINCAGITGKTNIKSHETETDNIRTVFDINFMGCYFTSKHVLPIMLKHHYGRILHIASIAGKEGNAGMLAYSASKAAVIGMTKVQGKEYAESGITINALAPAVIQTPLVDAMPAEQVKYMTDKIPMKRCGTLEEIADMALFVVSPKNSFTTGFTFDMSGGRATY
ncbi:MAG: SDR family NAD(P)-dependent oxidoreductase [Saprospiraceae bacterium]